MKTYLAIAAAALISVSGANATSIYTTSGSSDLVSNNYSSQTYEDDGVTMKVTAGIAFNGNVVEGQHGARPTAYSNGTGIRHNDNDGQHTIDSWYPEVAILAFDALVQLKGVMFSYVDSYDTFDIFGDTNNDGTLELLHKSVAMPNTSTAYVDLLSFNLVGTLFGIGASEYEKCYTDKYGREKCYTKKPDWKLKKVKFEEQEVPEVPLPAALPLFLAGMAGFGFAARKKKA